MIISLINQVKLIIFGLLSGIITGKVDSFVYTSDKSKVKKDSVIARLFR